MSSRGLAPVVGVVLLTLVTVGLAGVTVAIVTAGSDGATTADSFDVSLSVTYDEEKENWALTLRHTGGDPVDLEDLTLRILVNDEPLIHQPTLPVSGAKGFNGFAAGVFNAKSDNRWSPTERGTLWIAGTNSPTIESGDRVIVRLRREDRVLAERTAIASA